MLHDVDLCITWVKFYIEWPHFHHHVLSLKRSCHTSFWILSKVQPCESMHVDKHVTLESHMFGQHPIRQSAWSTAYFQNVHVGSVLQSEVMVRILGHLIRPLYCGGDDALDSVPPSVCCPFGVWKQPNNLLTLTLGPKNTLAFRIWGHFWPQTPFRHKR